MILVFFILFFIGILFSKLNLEINNFYFQNIEGNKKINFLVKLSLKIFGLFPIVYLKIDEKFINFWGFKIKNKILKKDTMKKRIGKNLLDMRMNLDEFKSLNFTLDNLDLNLCIGTESVIATVIITLLFSTFIAFQIRNFEGIYSYSVNPDYEEKNKLRLKFNGNLNIKVIDIIKFLKLKIKRR